MMWMKFGRGALRPGSSKTPPRPKTRRRCCLGSCRSCALRPSSTPKHDQAGLRKPLTPVSLPPNWTQITSPLPRPMPPASPLPRAPWGAPPQLPLIISWGCLVCRPLIVEVRWGWKCGLVIAVVVVVVVGAREGAAAEVDVAADVSHPLGTRDGPMPCCRQGLSGEQLSTEGQTEVRVRRVSCSVLYCMFGYCTCMNKRSKLWLQAVSIPTRYTSTVVRVIALPSARIDD